MNTRVSWPAKRNNLEGLFFLINKNISLEIPYKLADKTTFHISCPLVHTYRDSDSLCLRFTKKNYEIDLALHTFLFMRRSTYKQFYNLFLAL